LENIKCIVPPLSEQKLIVEYLDKKINEVNRLISIKQKKIAELKEYKKTLIYEYITGKKEVPA
jgi:type I restriction enzyme S subunit